MSKKVMEFCNNCERETPHRLKRHCYKADKGKYASFLQPIWCLTCGYKPQKIAKPKTAKHISLR